MHGDKKKKQLRRCQACQKVGHNRATCPEVIAPASLPPKPTPAAVKFFVHHVQYEPHRSEHVVNLREKKTSIWDAVDATQHETPAPTLFHTHHTVKESAPTPSFLRPAPPAPPKHTAPSQQIITPATKPTFDIRKKSRALFSGVSSLFETLSTKLRPVLNLERAAFASAVFVILTLLPGQAHSYYTSLTTTKNTATEESIAGFLALRDSTAKLKQGAFAEASRATSEAVAHFETATTLLAEKHNIIQSVAGALPVIGGEVKSGKHLILAGQEIALGNSFMLKGITEVSETPSSTVPEHIEILREYLASALPNYLKARDNLSAVNIDTLPLEYRTTFEAFRTLFSAATSDFKNIGDLAEALHEIIGGAGFRRYLIIFQNEHEQRATGGFMGSFAILEMKNGKLIKLDVPPGGSYDLKGQLDQHLEPPRPLLMTNKRWEFQDANWFPDFPASAEKIAWFYEHARGTTVDGVIAVNSSVLERLLSLTGPLTDESRGLTLTQNNAITELQHVVEFGPEKKENKPKAVIGDLAKQFVDRFKTLTPAESLPLLLNLEDALAQKEIQMYFTNQGTQNTVRSFGWSGAIAPTSPGQDYLSVVNTNISGAKSDAKITQHVSHQAMIQEDGSIVNTVIITRTHSGTPEEDLYGQVNTNYVRVYVPEGSTLVSASGFSWPDERAFRASESWYKPDAYLAKVEQNERIDERSGTRITDEFGKTVFANWVVTPPGETSQIEFTYRLPFTLSRIAHSPIEEWKNTFLASSAPHPYQLVVQRQSGSDSTFDSQVLIPDMWNVSWKSDPSIEIAKNGVAVKETNLTTDHVWSILIEP